MKGRENLNMFKKLCFIVIIAVIIVLSLGFIGKAYSNNAVTITSSNIQNTRDFISSLEKAGHKIKTIQDVGEGLLPGDLTTINIDGDTIGVYEYKNNQAMEEQAKTIHGSRIGNTFYDFITTPHFYKNGYIIVSYIGVDKKTIKEVEKLMGKQFEGM